MRRLRKLIYRLGFRPKHPSIFFSPSLNATRSYKHLESLEKKIQLSKPIVGDMEAYYRYVSEIVCLNSTCKYKEPHKHGFACDVTCWTCRGLTTGKTSKS